jgi:hypothetical protein
MLNDQTPWAVVCPEHGLQYLTKTEYFEQMHNVHAMWQCPICGKGSQWNDENYDHYDGPDHEDGEWADGWDIRNS